VNLLDVALGLLLAAAIANGVRLGGVARVVSWAGLLAGLGLGILLAAVVAHLTALARPALQLTAALAALVGGTLAGQALGLAATRRLGRPPRRGHLGPAKRLAGGLVGALGALLATWLVLPSLAGVPGAISAQARGSLVGRALDSIAPAAPDALADLRRLLEPSGSGLPIRPAVASSVPATSGIASDVLAEEEASTVEVEGAACQRLQVGSGFAIGPNLVLTAAHVVAGELETTVTTVTGRRLAARVVRFDPNRDVALLRVDGLALAGIKLTAAETGETGAVLGHPGGQDRLAVAPAVVTDELVASGRDIYGRSQTRRDLLVLGAAVHPGDSGGPVVDRSGDAVGMVFAVSPDHPSTAYALSRSELGPDLGTAPPAPEPTGRCVEDR
jgi:S1-C subfamily serine protease